MHKKISKNSNSMDYKYNLVSLTITNYDIVKDGLGLKKANYLIITTLEKMKNHIKDNFTIGSSGKNEFMILLECNKNDNIILEFANKILNEFKNPFVIENQEIYV